MTNETKGVSVELVTIWAIDFVTKSKNKSGSSALDYVAQRAYEKGLEDAARVCDVEAERRDSQHGAAWAIRTCADAISNLAGGK
jgi:hypothetical protein